MDDPTTIVGRAGIPTVLIKGSRELGGRARTDTTHEADRDLGARPLPRAATDLGT